MLESPQVTGADSQSGILPANLVNILCTRENLEGHSKDLSPNSGWLSWCTSTSAVSRGAQLYSITHSYCSLGPGYVLWDAGDKGKFGKGFAPQTGSGTFSKQAFNCPQGRGKNCDFSQISFPEILMVRWHNEYTLSSPTAPGHPHRLSQFWDRRSERETQGKRGWGRPGMTGGRQAVSEQLVHVLICLKQEVLSVYLAPHQGL